MPSDSGLWPVISKMDGDLIQFSKYHPLHPLNCQLLTTYHPSIHCFIYLSSHPSPTHSLVYFTLHSSIQYTIHPPSPQLSIHTSIHLSILLPHASTHPCTHTITYSCTHSLTDSSVHLSVCRFVHLFVHLFMYSPAYLVSKPFTYLFIRLPFLVFIPLTYPILVSSGNRV